MKYEKRLKVYRTQGNATLTDKQLRRLSKKLNIEFKRLGIRWMNY